jgi:hypothetical protein
MNREIFFYLRQYRNIQNHSTHRGASGRDTCTLLFSLVTPSSTGKNHPHTSERARKGLGLAPVTVQSGAGKREDEYRTRNIRYTDKKENQIFLIYKVIQSVAVSRSYMRKGFLIYEEMRKYFSMYKEAVSHT